ncbi:MAG TPA: TonB-dependent receptor [Micropepsaceae bacterium]|nr:TonB-dependent receptor [Micropepsaceae bacterium]
MMPETATEIPEQVTVTAERTSLVGIATTSSQGEVVQQELQLTPAFRPGQLLETIPGLVVTAHSGEGKANEYLLRGFSLDHGTDLATFVDGMPANMPTHTHGQGYTDLNFLIPELVQSVQFTKGPYFAEQGDFSSVGSDHISLLDTVEDQVSVQGGTMGFQRLFTAGSRDTTSGTVLGAVELQHYDGPWVHPDDMRKINALARYTAGDASNGYSLTAMYYRGLWNATTDQPVRAMDPAYMTTLGLTPISRFGTLDPTDGGSAQRISLSGQYHVDLGEAHVDANAFGIYNRLTLWNNFTHYLFDPVNGDQEAQSENRTVLGGAGSYEIPGKIFGFDNDFVAGLWTRWDDNHVGRNTTTDRQYLSTTEDDQVSLLNLAGYLSATTHWTDWMRTVLGLREDYITANDNGSNTGKVSAALFQPKANLIISPWQNTEFYLSAGRGFHSDDARGVTQAEAQGITGAPLIAISDGAELGVRSTILPNLTATFTLFMIHFQSETTYDPDIGQDSAGPPSQREGFEFNTTYQPFSWLELYESFAASRARYTTPSDDGTGHVGEYIPNAPTAIASFAAYLRNLGPWTAGLEYRYLGGFPLTPDNAVKGKGYGELNLDTSYTFESGWKLGFGIYNLLDTKADAAEFWYIDRLPGEAAEGVADRHIHPIEPRSFRFTLAKMF